jgi:DNA (cytosine-5)-methyltransferase 1
METAAHGSVVTAYYNEHDAYAAAWLRNLIAAGLIAPGDVDARSICDVQASDLAGYDQRHFFAGIGGWSYALRLAGWPDERPVWTGSCPCQPFSVAGKRKGAADSRHLWPEFLRLIDERRPTIVFGEQVASKDGRAWLAGVRADLEALAYGVGAADLSAAGVGAPHIRQRLWWVAYANRAGHALGTRIGGDDGAAERALGRDVSVEDGADGRVGDPDGQRRDGQHALLRADPGGRDAPGVPEIAGPCAASGLEQPSRYGREQRRPESSGRGAPGGCGEGDPWSGAIWIPCADGKARRIEPGLEPLVNGVSGRVGRLRAYGNAIVPQIAAEFVIAAMDTIMERRP